MFEICFIKCVLGKLNNKTIDDSIIDKLRWSTYNKFPWQEDPCRHVMFVFDHFNSSSRLEHHDYVTLVQDLTWCVYLEEDYYENYYKCIYDVIRLWISMRFFWNKKLNLPLLQENVEFSVGTDQNRWALSLPRYPICIAIEPNMVACEPKNINYIALKISWNSTKITSLDIV